MYLTFFGKTHQPWTMGLHLDRARPSELRMDSHLGAMVDESCVCVSGTGLAKN